MEFLVHISTLALETMPPDEVDGLRERAAARAAELIMDGLLVRLWQVPGTSETWGLWDAIDEYALTRALDALPLRALMDIEIVPLEPHPSDPQQEAGPLRERPTVSFGEVLSVLVARRAAARGVDLNEVTGTGPGGYIRLVDVHQARPTLPPGEG